MCICTFGLYPLAVILLSSAFTNASYSSSACLEQRSIDELMEQGLNVPSLVPRPPHFCLQFAFSRIHGNRSTSVYYTEHKLKHFRVLYTNRE